MTVQEASKMMKYNLQSKYELREAANITDWIMEEITGLSRIDRLINNNHKLSSIQESNWNIILSKLEIGMPIQYVLGYGWFMGFKLKVNEQVLIPRPETEELVQWVLESCENKTGESLSIIDIGTGSGCIPIGIKKSLIKAKVYALDISEGALIVARENAEIHHCEIEFQQFDILNEKKWAELPKVSIIISNPPYIPIAEAIEIEIHVKDFEPHLALFVENEYPLLFYKKILTFSTNNLLPGGMIFFECNEKYSKEVMELGVKFGYNSTIQKDMQGKDRMIRFKKDYLEKL
jgi:release factor glutamine methyltransferase